MLKNFILLSIFFIVSTSYAKDVWIQFVGIDELNPQQNITSFYKSAKDFQIACEMNVARLCESYMNLNPNLLDLADDEKDSNIKIINELSKNSKVNKGKISRIRALKRIESILINAKEKDQIVLAFENHGAPVIAPNKGKSCIYINGSDCISDEDIKFLIKKHPLPKNARIAILADGCYSGGFHDLMNDSVCVATTADQYSIGSAPKDKNFWQYISEDKIKSFSELVNIQKTGQKTYRTSQSVYDERKCADYRKKFTTKNFIRLLDDLLLQFANADRNDYICNSMNPDKTIDRLTQLINEIGSIYYRKDEFNKNRKFKTSSNNSKIRWEIHQRLVNFLNYRKNKITGVSYFKRVFAAKDKFSDITNQYENLSKEEAKCADFFYELDTNVAFNEENKFTNLNSTQIANAKKIGKLVKMLEIDYIKAQEELISFVENINNSLNNVEVAEIDFIYSCYLNNEGLDLDDNNTLEWNRIAKKHNKKVFTTFELNKAKKCENSFKF